MQTLITPLSINFLQCLHPKATNLPLFLEHPAITILYWKATPIIKTINMVSSVIPYLQFTAIMEEYSQII